MNRSSVVLIASALALASPTVACSPPPPPGDAPETDASADVPADAVAVRVGTGQSDWDEIPPETGRLELIFGAQGGYHVWGRARFRGLQPDVDVTMTVTRVEDGLLVSNVLLSQRRWIDRVMMVRRGLLDVGGGEYVTNAEQLVLMVRCASEVIGRRLRIDLTVVERATGRVLTDSREGTVVDEVAPVMCAPGADAGRDGS